MIFRPRMFKGIPDSELAPRVVLVVKLGLKMASRAKTVEVLPAEPVTPMMVSSLPWRRRRSLTLTSWSLAKKRR